MNGIEKLRLGLVAPLLYMLPQNIQKFYYYNYYYTIKILITEKHFAYSIVYKLQNNTQQLNKKNVSFWDFKIVVYTYVCI